MRTIFSLALFLFFLSGCSTTTYNRDVPSGKIDNPEVIISATDGSYKLQGKFKSPFQSSTRYNSLAMRDKELIKGYRDALHHGAQHVKVKVPSLEKELYGVLALDRADQDGVGPGTQSYKIIIPEPYVKAAQNGKISVVYEYYKLKNDGIIDVGNIKERSWILWLSDKDIFQ